MSIIRSLDSFSLPELFNVIENDSKSGRLIIEAPISHQNSRGARIYYLWFENGYLVAVSNCLNQKGLIDLIAARGWLSPVIIPRLRKLCPIGIPLGVYLGQMKLLTQEKLSLIFQLQLHQVYRLFQLSGGRFRFSEFSELQDRIVTIPWLEMTGHRIRTKEVNLYALRLMENSENFGGQLLEPNQILIKTIAHSHLKLTTIERQIWNYINGETSLLTISRIIKIPINIVQVTAFRLLAVELVETVFATSDRQEIENYQKVFSF